MIFTQNFVEKEIEWLVKNWDRVPDDFKKNIQGGEYSKSGAVIPGVPLEEHTVIVLLDRQKPSVSRDYSFDEERITITRSGKIVWGFDSGCSCPSPWADNYPNCYTCTQTWKEFEINIKDFDAGAVEEVLGKIMQIRQTL